MKITIVTGIFSKEKTFFFHDMVKAFADFGAEVTVVAAYPDQNESEESRKECIRHPVSHPYDHVTVRWTGPVSRESGGLFLRMLRYLYLTASLYREAAKTETDVYYLYSTPPFLGYIGILLAAKYAPTLYDAQDLFPDSLVHIKGWSERSPLIRFLRFMERQVYRGNSHINVISGDMRKTVIANGCPPEKAGVIFYGANTEEISHVERKDNRLFDEYRIARDHFIISYGGSIRYLQRWDTILDAAEILEKKIPEAEFLIFGSGRAADGLKEKITKRGLKNVRVYPALPSNRMAELYSLGDIELVTLEAEVTRFALPSKLWMIMAAASPVLAVLDDPSEIADIIRKNRLGYVIDTHSGKRLAGVIDGIYKRRMGLPEMGRNARAYVESRHDLKEHYHMYYEELERLANESGNHQLRNDRKYRKHRKRARQVPAGKGASGPLLLRKRREPGGN